MRKALNIVKGAVATTSTVEQLTHVLLADGRVRAFNGVLSIDTALPNGTPFDIPVTVPADKLRRALDSCTATPRMTLNDEYTHLTVAAGQGRRFRIPVTTKQGPLEYSPVEWETRATLTEPLLQRLFALLPFCCTDAQHQWAMSVLLTGGHAYATNNVVLARGELSMTAALTQSHWPHDITLAVPAVALAELQRIRHAGDPPVVLRESANRVQLLWPGATIECAKGAAGWPDVAPMFDDFYSSDIPDAPDLVGALKAARHFCEDAKFPVVTIGPEGLRAGDDSSFAEDATVTYDGETPVKFHVQPLALVAGVAAAIDFSSYPQPCRWAGPLVHGFLVGVV